MRAVDEGLTSGIPALDQMLRGINAGDNIVWEIEAIEDYAALVRPFARAALAAGRRLVYIRFAAHPPLLSEEDLQGEAPALLHTVDPQAGFEPFLDAIHAVISAAGRGAFYVFDCLSDVGTDWYSDEMLGNLFMLTCPHLYDLETVTYFALRWGRHGSRALSPILETTQLYLEVHRSARGRYIRPVKVQHRYTSTMHMLHRWEGDAIHPVASSAEVAEVLASSPRSASLHAPSPERRGGEDWESLARSVLSRDPALLELARRWITTEDLLRVRRRLIGSGLVGGKAAGVLLSRAILRGSEPELSAFMEEHDSFYVGTDLYCTFLVRNGVWWLRQRQRDPESYLEGAEQARRRILTGTFPEETMRELEAMLDYFGQSPYVVRSSSLLEDSFGSAFAGKYESVFCANQGPRERRVADFLAAVREVYASAMGERALRYRAERGLLERDEQMGLLVMRVSGSLYGRRFFPAAAGVGYSYNPFVWSPDIDPRAGVLRLVFGLGTRAVNRMDDDYARLVALNAPLRRPESSFDEVCRYAQRKADVIDLEADRLVSIHVLDLARDAPGLPLDLLLSRERGWEGQGKAPEALTFDGLLGRTPFVGHVRRMLRALEEGYGAPVDVELTVNLDAEGGYRINLLQCRRLHVRGTDAPRLSEVEVPPERLMLAGRGAVVGHSRLLRVGRFVYVVPSAYAALPLQSRHEVARLLGQLNRVAGRASPGEIVLIGPGRWGTTSPELGVPVSFNEISRSSVVCEIVAMREELVPDVSLGTHFLNDLVESDMLYVALFPGQVELAGLERFLLGSPNRLLELAPDAGRWTELLRVVDVRDALPPGESVLLAADAVEQRVSCYREEVG